MVAALLSFSLHVLAAVSIAHAHYARSRAYVKGNWTLSQDGVTGVNAQQLAIVTDTTAVIFDKVQDNPMTLNGHPAWASEFNLVTRQARPLKPTSNAWCASGGFLGNGTFVDSGGNPKVGSGTDGLQALRLFTPCQDESCDIYENPLRVRMNSPRWYPSTVRIEDGSLLIFGGSVNLDYINSPRLNNPTYEFYPVKNIHGYNGLHIPSQFMVDTLNANHFPILIQLPDGTVFVAANRQAMIFDWKTNTETRLPRIPNGVRITSPFSAGAALLPLTPENNYTPEVLICGGSKVSDSVAPTTLSSQTPASKQCSRLVLTPEGIAAGWSVERMPHARVMPEIIHLPDQRLLIINGAKTGIAGYGNVGDQIGSSNADNPAFKPVIYDPNARSGHRFSSAGIPASTIPRLYHSTASLTPNGSIIVAGSNPNDNVQTREYPTEYRVEFYDPPYMQGPRPDYTGLPANVDYGVDFELTLNLPDGVEAVDVVLIDLGFSTHAVHMDARLVKLQSTLNGTSLIVTGPPTPRIYPPGPGFLYVVTEAGVPSFGHKVMIGNGTSPPVDQSAIDNMLRKTTPPEFIMPGDVISSVLSGFIASETPIPSSTAAHGHEITTNTTTSVTPISTSH